MSAVLTLFLAKAVDDHYYFLEDEMIDYVRALNPKVLCQRALYLAVTRQGTAFLWSNGIADEDGVMNQWHASALDIIKQAKVEWLTVYPNKQAGGYDYRPGDNQTAEPEWPILIWEELLRLAFRRYHIDNRDHPILKRLRGEN
jgi:hypothetical protein